MAKSSIQCFIFLVLTTTFVTNVSCQDASDDQYREVDDQSKFNYERGDENGPERWGKLNETWRLCGKGDMQSPIDLTHERVKIVTNLEKLSKNYKPSNATLMNRGHDMMLDFGEEGSAGSININGDEYKLLQLHWHSPSEHTFNGSRFALELHMVHENINGSTAVLTVLYRFGQRDSFLGLLENKLKRIIDKDARAKYVDMIDPRDVKIDSRKYYRYIGSLTIPPCTENVIWTIVTKVRTVSRFQVKLLRVAVNDGSDTNARPVQPINNRIIKLFWPKFP